MASRVVIPQLELEQNDNPIRPIVSKGAKQVVVFPKGGSYGQIKGFLDRYLGFDKELIEQIRTMPSRWVFIHKEYPQYIIYEKGALIF